MRRILVAGLCLAFAVRPAAAQQAPPLGGPTFSGFIFGDVVYLASEADGDEGFVLGQVVGHGTASLSDRLAFFGELSLTARDASYGVEVERAILRYDFSDEMKVSAGRYHTPVSFWNTAYHHGLWLQTSVARPEMIRFGSRFLPVHFVGLQVEGRLPGELGFGYQAGVGNGRAAIISRAGDAGDLNGARAWVGSAWVEPLALGGLRLGGAAYLDDVSREGAAAVDERILSAHAAWERGRPELIVEVADVSHDASGVDHGSRGFYAHAGYTLGEGARAFTPYLRVEQIDVDGDDPVFADLLEDYDAVLGGVRYDFETLAAVKAEVRRETFGDDDAVTSLYLQASFAVPGIGGGP